MSLRAIPFRAPSPWRVLAPIRAVAAMLVAAALAGPAAAADPQGQRMLAAFNDWVASYGVPNASISIMRGGRRIAEGGVGSHTPTSPQGLASLSKAITGVCIAKIVEAGELSYDTKLRNLIPAYFRRHPPFDPMARHITVGQLLTHSSRMGYDPTQGADGVLAGLDWRRPNYEAQLAAALDAPLLADNVYKYNNANYVALGLVIETVTGMPYEEFCNEAVLKPAGITRGRIDRERRVFNAYGGWSLSARDYAKFMEHFRPASGLMATGPAAWPKSPPFSSGSWYGIGTFVRAAGASYHFWHDGALYWNEPGRPERTMNFGTYEVMYAQDLHFAVTFAPQPPWGAVGDLDARMYNAAFPSARGGSRPAPELGAPATQNGTDRGPVR